MRCGLARQTALIWDDLIREGVYLFSITDYATAVRDELVKCFKGLFRTSFLHKADSEDDDDSEGMLTVSSTLRMMPLTTALP